MSDLSKSSYQAASYQAAVRFSHRVGFTLIEVMIALVLSLVVLAAAVRAFKQIGDRITQSQSEVETSVALRDVSGRLLRDLDSIFTSPVIDPNEPTQIPKDSGYLVYHEGPMTNETTAHVSIGLLGETRANREDYFELSRYGDLDDYLAFTATARPEAPFVGFIPYGVLAGSRYFELRNGRYGGANPPVSVITNPGGGAYTAEGAATMVPFYSTQAEIAYWVSPVWRRHTNVGLAGTLDYLENDGTAGTPEDGSGHPLFRDFEGDIVASFDADGIGDRQDDSDGLPDRCMLHRRVLLVRPDLNVPVNDMGGSLGSNPGALPFLLPNGNLVPLSFVNSVAAGVVEPGMAIDLPGTWWQSNAAIGLDNLVGNQAAEAMIDFLEEVSPNWLTGLARLQQIMDLSVSRVTNDWATASTTLYGGSNYGMPSRLVQANSIAGLSRPENRFAHVRVPRRLLAPANQPDARASSLPVLALAGPIPFMVAAETYTRPNSAVPQANPALPDPSRHLPSVADPDGSSSDASGTGDLQTSSRYGRFTMMGFLRPEFNLADQFAAAEFNATGPVTVVQPNVPRGGSDVVAQQLLSFDVQIYDPKAKAVTWYGPDGVAGGVGDDDGDMVDDNIEEAGWPDSDDSVFGLNDLSIQRALQPTSTVYLSRPQGGFVDLNYMLLSGHPLGSPWPYFGTGTATSPIGLLGELRPFSGLGVVGLAPDEFNVSAAIQQSGVPIIRETASGGSLNSFIQSTYDTHTSLYQTDGRFDEEGNAPVSVMPRVESPKYFTGRLTHSMTDRLASANPPIASRLWSCAAGVPQPYASPDPELDATGLPETPTPDSEPLHITAPVTEPLRALQIQIRLIDTATGEIQQRTIVHSFGRF